MGTHLVFADSLQGDLNNKELKFERGVRIGVRSVASWNEVFDAATMDALAEGQATIDCQTLRFAQSPTAPSSPSPYGVGRSAAGPALELAGCLTFPLEDADQAAATVAAAARMAFEGPAATAVLIDQRLIGAKTFSH